MIVDFVPVHSRVHRHRQDRARLGAAGARHRDLGRGLTNEERRAFERYAWFGAGALKTVDEAVQAAVDVTASSSQR